jgi:hypothetical protein
MKKSIFCLSLIISLSAFAFQVKSQSLTVTLTWSADTYVPASYPGQALPSRGSIVEVAANIDSGAANPQNLAYNWYLNDDIQREASGQGKQTLRFDVGDQIGKTHFVEARIADLNGEIIGQSQRLAISPVEPQIIVSLIKPRLDLLDLTELLAGKFRLFAEQETKFVARPYFFNIKNPEELNYNWKFGEEKISPSATGNPNVFVLRIGEVIQPITKLLNLFVENKNNLIQRAQTEAEITINP